jgi:hypothetical protein
VCALIVPLLIVPTYWACAYCTCTYCASASCSFTYCTYVCLQCCTYTWTCYTCIFCTCIYFVVVSCYALSHFRGTWVSRVHWIYASFTRYDSNMNEVLLLPRTALWTSFSQGNTSIPIQYTVLCRLLLPYLFRICNRLLTYIARD